LDTSTFAAMPIFEWIKALIRPHELLNISCADVELFQLNVVLVLDAIWSARNDKVHNGTGINLQKLIIRRTSFTKHSKAWIDKSLVDS
jgi:hypothetical protein